MPLATIAISPDIQLAIAGTLVGGVIGYFVGLRTNFIIGRVFEYRAFLHQALFEVRLMSGRMMKDSSDFRRVPRADQAVLLYADQVDSIGQIAAASALRDVADKMAKKFEACQHRDLDLDFHADKAAWVSTLTSLSPRWPPFFQRRKSAQL